MASLTTLTFDLSDPQARAFVRTLLDGLDQKKPTGPIYTPIPASTPAPPPPAPDPIPPLIRTFQELAGTPIPNDGHKAKVLLVLRQADGTMRAGNIAKAAGLTIEQTWGALADASLFKREGLKRWSAHPVGGPVPPTDAPADAPPPQTKPKPEPGTHHKTSPEAAALRVRMVEALRAFGKPMSPKKLAETLGADKVKVNNYLNIYAGRLFLKDSKERNSGWLAK